MGASLTEAQEAALLSLLRVLSGLPGAKVLWEPVRNTDGTTAPRPALPYLTARVIAGPTARGGTPDLRYADIDGEDPADIIGVLVVADRTATPPVDPAADAAYLVDADGTGDFEGHDDEIATWTGDAWTFDEPGQGDRVSVTASEDLLRYGDEGWADEPDMRIERAVQHRAFTLTVNAYAAHDGASAAAQRIVARISGGLRGALARGRLRDAGLAYIREAALTNLDELVDAERESRAALDVVFGVSTESMTALDVFETVSGTVTGTIGDTTITVPGIEASAA